MFVEALRAIEAQGNLPVPRVEGDPSAGNTRFRYLLYPARSGEPKFGTLLVHFGVPGSSATHTLPDFIDGAAIYSPEIVKGFDIVELDDLGVGPPDAVHCANIVTPRFPATTVGKRSARPRTRRPVSTARASTSHSSAPPALSATSTACASTWARRP